VFEAIVYVLRTGCQWKALPEEHFGSASAVHKRFKEWSQLGFFFALWQAGLAESDEMEGIAWHWKRQTVSRRSTHRRIWVPAVSRRQRTSATSRESRIAKD